MAESMTRFEWERKAMAQPFGGNTVRILWAFASFADAQTLITWPKIEDVVAVTGIGKGQVQQRRKALLEAGWLEESEEKTSRGNAKLRLAVGRDIEPQSYLGESGREVSAASKANLVPAAKQKKAKSLDHRDEAGHDNRENAGHDNRENAGHDNRENEASESLDHRDVTTIEQPVSRTTNNNQEENAPVVATAPTVTLNELREIKEGSETETFSCLREDYVPVVSEGVTYFFSFEGVTSTVADAPVENESLSPKSNKKAVEVDETKEGYPWLLHLLREAKASEVRSKQAFDYFFDKTWKPEKTGDHRASAAVTYSDEPKVMAGGWW